MNGAAGFLCYADYTDCNGSYYNYDESSNVRWISSDTSVAAVDCCGDVTPVGSGEASITADPYTDYRYTYSGGNCYSTQVSSSAEVYIKTTHLTARTTSGFGGTVCSVAPACVAGVAPTCPQTTVLDAAGCYPIGYYCKDIAYRFSQTAPYTCFGLDICERTTVVPGFCD